jgi:ABC-2 type transport system permease protein
MSSLARHFGIALHLVRTSIGAQAQYRFDFLLQLFMSAFWVSWNVAPVWIIFEIRPDIAGWNRDQAMLVMSSFLMLRSLIEGIVSPNLNQIVWQIRQGTFDFVLLKPVDAQLLVSVSKVVPAKLVDFSTGVVLTIYAIGKLDPQPSGPALLAAGLMLAGGAITIYAIWLLISCTAFWFVKVDNLAFLFSSVFDAARWPIAMFRGWVRVLLTYVIPVAIMTSYPALALLGLLDLQSAAIAWGSGLLLLALSRLVWRSAVRHYSSASS